MKKIIILIPVFNDWESLQKLLIEKQKSKRNSKKPIKTRKKVKKKKKTISRIKKS